MFLTRAPRRSSLATILAGVALVAAGCGSSSSHTSTTTPAATVAAKPPQPQLHLRVLAPRNGSHVGNTVTVRVRLSPANQPGTAAFRYALDGGRPRNGADHLTLRNLKPGHHHLVVTVAGKPETRASSTFTVRMPPQPATSSAPSTTMQMTTSPHASTAPAQTTTSSAPPPRTTPAPPPRTTTPSAPPSGGIPQGKNAGDGDSDNHGGPSDGDGNI
jgi:hypothetical protein